MKNYKLLNERELLELLQNGDKIAEEELYNRNVKFISYVIKKFNKIVQISSSRLRKHIKTNAYRKNSLKLLLS